RYELIKRISDKFGVEEIEAGVFVDSIFGYMVTAFKKGKKINIPEFGKFNIISKTIDGVRQRYVIFSPAKNFADAINKNFSDLEPIVVNAFNVKHKEILKVKEIIPESDDEEYLYFEFDSSAEEMQNEVSSGAIILTEEVFVKDEEPEQESVIEEKSQEEITAASLISGDVFVKEEEQEQDSLIEEKLQEEEITAASLISGDVFVREEEAEQESVIEEITKAEENQSSEVIMDSKTEQSIFTDINPIIDDEIISETTAEDIIFNEEIAANVISHQTIFADNPIDIILPEGIPLPEFTENPEEQIAENEKIIDEVNHTTSLSIRVTLKDDMNVENIKEEILDILVRREEIIRELNVFNTTAEADTKQEDVITPDTEISGFPKFEDLFGSDDKPEIPQKPEAKEVPESEDDSNKLFTELEKRIRELDELSKKQEDIKKAKTTAPMSQEMQIFGKLIDDSRVIEGEKLKEEPHTEIIIPETEPEKEYVEPKSLSEALQDTKLDGIIEHLKPEDDIKSYDDIFRKSDSQFTPQFSVEQEEKNTQGRFFKIFLYVFFVFLLTAFSFYIYKTMFTKSSGNQAADTSGFKKIDSVRALLKHASDSIAGTDNTSLTAEDESGQTESVEVKDINGVIYREIGKKIYIQNKVMDDLSEASDLELKLKSNNLNCIVEGATKIDSGLEYRVLVGPFKSIEEAIEYYEKHKVILNFMQIINPGQPKLLVF
ncbi:MAG: HU family DNA-binding protein, partial [Ignavibacteria bacterium]